MRYENSRHHQHSNGELIGQDLINDAMAFGPYREIYERLISMLIPDYPIPDGTPVSVLGNNRLREYHFRLRDADRLPVRTVTNPGKSAHIAHTDSVAIATLTMLGREADRTDRLYTIPSAEELREIGIVPVYAPTGRAPLHVRLVPERLDELGDMPQEMREQLVQLAQRHQVPQNLRRF